MDRHLLTGSIFVLLLQVVYLLNDLGALRSIWPDTSSELSNKKSIGVMLHQKNYVRRKFSNSFFWQETENKTALYNKDSILTLEESSATVKLNNDLILQLHENTLVELQPVEENKNSEITITFKRGLIKTNSISKNTVFKHNNWKISAKKGSSLHLRNVGEKNLELEVSEGSAQLQNTTTSVTTEVNDLEKINMSEKEVIGSQKLTDSLSWQTKSQTVYYHQFPATFDLQWKGSAKKLTHKNLNEQTVKTIAIESNQNQQLNLEAGTHIFSLDNENVSSKSLYVNVARAPQIQYLSPLPRSRHSLSSNVTFSWAPIKTAKEYMVEFSKDRDFKDKRVEVVNFPHFKNSFLETGRYFWRVTATDKQGQTIPSYYHNEIYLIKNPLSAPKMITPKLRQPANSPPATAPPVKKMLEPKTSLINILFDLLLPKAHAKLNEAIVFRWEPVKEAVRYVVEISDDPSFNKLLNDHKVTNTELEWTPPKDGKYYWRVAGENDTQMGFFSEAQSFNTKELKTLSEGVMGVGVKEVKVIEPKPLPIAKPIAKPEPTPAPEVKLIWVQDKQWSAKLSPTYKNFQYSSETDRKASYSGFTFFDFSLGYWFTYKEKPIITNFQFSSTQWKPSNDLNLQKNLTIQNFFASLEVQRTQTQHWGGYLNSIKLPSRFSNETVDLENFAFVGFLYNWQQSLGAWETKYQVEVGASNKFVQVRSHNEFKQQFFYRDTPYDYGLIANLEYLHGFSKQNALNLEFKLFLQYVW